MRFFCSWWRAFISGFCGGEMRILDRYILKSFLVNYFLALFVLIGMYVLLDVIVKAQDFARGAAPTPAVATATATDGAIASKPSPASGSSGLTIAGDMFDYYIYQIPVIFQQVSGIIPVLAAGFTMVRMTRHNELTAMLASGVSLYRVAAPIIALSVFFAALNVLNQELLISQPGMIEKLLRRHDEMNQVAEKNEPLILIKCFVDPAGRFTTTLQANDYDPQTRTMTGVFIFDRDSAGMPLRHTKADSARWQLDPVLNREAWVMTNVFDEDDFGPNPHAGTSEKKTLATSLTPEQLDLILSKKAIDYLSWTQLSRLAQFPAEANKPLLEKMMHMRFTQPLMNLVMLLIGIPFLLTREPNRLVINMLYCTIMSAVIFVTTFVISQLGAAHIPPIWAAWLPILIFAPFAVVMLDTIHT